MGNSRLRYELDFRTKIQFGIRIAYSPDMSNYGPRERVRAWLLCNRAVRVRACRIGRGYYVSVGGFVHVSASSYTDAFAHAIMLYRERRR